MITNKAYHKNLATIRPLLKEFWQILCFHKAPPGGQTVNQIGPNFDRKQRLLTYKSKGQCKAWHMPPIGTLSVGVWTIRFREKWNMVKIDDPKQSDQLTGIRHIIDGNQIQDGYHSGHFGWAVIERNLPPVTPNEPPKNQTSRRRITRQNQSGYYNYIDDILIWESRKGPWHHSAENSGCDWQSWCIWDSDGAQWVQR
jgi:hypothetical protein